MKFFIILLVFTYSKLVISDVKECIVIEDDKKRLNTIVYVSMEVIRKISILLYPIIPESSLKALNIFNIKETDIDFSTILNNNYLSPGKNINKIKILFNKIKND